MVRPEFSYVAENLLLRGGYRKTHFQADTVTFYNVSEMGTVFDGETKHLELNAETFEPKIVFKRENQRPPEKFYFRELVLQSLVRRKIQYSILKDALEFFGVDSTPEEFEVLGEKALPEGYVDIFIKLRHPRGTNKYLPVEVKTGKAQSKDLGQLMGYINEFSNETVGGILIAKDFPRSILNNPKILAVRYYFKDIDPSEEYSYEELLKMLTLEVIE
ncbi:hypothetical protein AMR53_09340 [Thermococcus thioreducens]|nr:hypothetical protein AMR53_09340 [Thermococcus thioreducens]